MRDQLWRHRRLIFNTMPSAQAASAYRLGSDPVCHGDHHCNENASWCDPPTESTGKDYLKPAGQPVLSCSCFAHSRPRAGQGERRRNRYQQFMVLRVHAEDTYATGRPIGKRYRPRRRRTGPTHVDGRMAGLPVAVRAFHEVACQGAIATCAIQHLQQ